MSRVESTSVQLNTTREASLVLVFEVCELERGFFYKNKMRTEHHMHDVSNSRNYD